MGMRPKANIKILQDANWIMPEYPDQIVESTSENLHKLATEIGKSGSGSMQDSIAVIADALGMHLNPRDPRGPFLPFAVFHDFRTAMLSDFEQSDLDIFEHILNVSNDPKVKARMADILWLLRKDVVFAKQAIESYLDSIDHYFEHIPEFKVNCRDFFRRIGFIAAQIKAPEETKVKIRVAFEKAVNAQGLEPDNMLRCIFLEEYLESGLMQDNQKWIDFADQQAEEAKKKNDFWKAQGYFECAASIASGAGDQTKEKEFEIKKAQLHEEEAHSLKRSGASAMLVQHRLELAIDSYRKIGGKKEKVEELHKELIGVQKEVVHEMKPISMEMDLTNPISNLKETVKKKSTFDALLHLAKVAIPAPFDSLKENAVKHLKEFPLRNLFGGSTVNEQGKTVARKPGSSPGNDQDRDIYLEILNDLATHASMHGFVVHQVRVELLSRHDYREEMFDPILVRHPLIPEDRVRLLRKGFLAGLQGDYGTAAHILIPQFENSIRLLFEQAGIITTSIDNDLIQKERDLNTLLYRKEIWDLFDHRMVMMFRCLFTEKSKFNFRNRFAHGLLSYNECFSEVAVYIWIFLLFFYFLGSEFRMKNKK